MTKQSDTQDINYVQTEYFCESCDTNHFGNCPKIKVTLTTSTHTDTEELEREEAMTTSPNKMSDKELKKEVLTQICLIKYGNTPSNLSSEQLAQVAFASSDMYHLIKQHREAYALEENKNGFFAACGVSGVEDLENVEQYYQMYRAELREKVGRDDKVNSNY